MTQKMKSIIGIGIAIVFFCSAGVVAAKQLPPFQELNPVTVKAASTLADKTIVTLTGKISAKKNVEDYTFQDSTGTIRIEFDDDDIPMNGFSVGTKMKIMGEVDKELTGSKLDVKNYKILK